MKTGYIRNFKKVLAVQVGLTRMISTKRSNKGLIGSSDRGSKYLLRMKKLLSHINLKLPKR